MKNTNKKKISTAVKPFFPVSLSTRITQNLKSFFWPIFLSVSAAVIVGICAYVAMGGLIIHAAPVLSPFKSALSLAVKRLVFSAVTLGTFLLGLGIAKWLGAFNEKPEPSYLAILRDETRPLPEPLRISNLRPHCVTYYNRNQNEVTIQKDQDDPGFEYPKSHIFLPLERPFSFLDKEENQAAQATHYREDDQRFLVYYPKLREEKVLNQQEIDLRSTPSYVSRPTKTFVGASRPLTSLRSGMRASASIPAPFVV